MAAYDHIDFAPPQAARDAARRALDVRAEKPESERGMMPVGLARARDLANGRRLSPATVRRMLAYFQRHEIDKRGETWDSQGAGWQAWHGWGGDAAFAWSRKIVRQLDAADRARKMGEAPAPVDAVAAIVLLLDEELAEYVDLPGASRESPPHVTLCVLDRDITSVSGASDLLRAAVWRWAASCPALPARLSGTLRFAGEESDAFALSVDAVGLSAAREDLVRHLRASGFDISGMHGFTPHVTLDYLPREAPSPALPYDLPLDTVLSACSVWIGAERSEPVVLAGVAAPWALSDGTDSARAVPYAAHPFEDSAWDADAAVKRLRAWAGVDVAEPPAASWDRYAEGFAVVRGPRDNLGSYILPHHDVKDGRLVTIPAGVSAAIGALHGARGGGVDVPGAVRDAAIKHLDQHREAWERARDAREASESIRGATESITCRDAAVNARTWNQIARYGTFRAHPQGAFSFAAQQFAEIVRNFRATRNRAVPVDYEHASERHPENVGQKGVPALAWIVDIEDRGDKGLWALFDWKDPEAVEHVRGERYRFLSPAVNFNARDKESGASIGARLTSCALTNQPFLDGMAPVTASDTPAPRASHGPVADASARMSLSPGDVHAPAIPSSLRNNMDKDKDKDPMTDELSELKSKYAQAMADAGALDKRMGEMVAASKSMADKLCAMRGRLCALAGIDDAEGAEDLVMERLAAIFEQMRAAERAEAEALAKRAASAHGLSDAPENLTRLTAMVLADKASFLGMFPKASASVTASEAPAHPAQSGAANPPPAHVATLLSTQVARADAPTVTPAPGQSVRDRSVAVNQLAGALLRDGKAKTNAEAILMADREIQKQAATNAVAPFVG